MPSNLQGLATQEDRSTLPESVHSYSDVQDELTIQDELVFKGQCLVIPTVLCME